MRQRTNLSPLPTCPPFTTSPSGKNSSCLYQTRPPLSLPCSENYQPDNNNQTSNNGKSWIKKIFTKNKEEPDNKEDPPSKQAAPPLYEDECLDNNEDLPTDDSLSPRENVRVIQLSERFERFMEGRLLLRDLLDPDHTTSLLKIFFNLIIGVIVCVIFGAIFFTIQEDLQKKRAQEMEAILIEINQCTREYFDNRCQPETRLKPIQEFCVEKEKCMMQDPLSVINTSRMTAGLIADILNDFVEPLSYKTIAFFFILLFGIILVWNCSIRGGNSSRKHDFRKTQEYEDINERLWRIERLTKANVRCNSNPAIENVRPLQRWKSS